MHILRNFKTEEKKKQQYRYANVYLNHIGDSKLLFGKLYFIQYLNEYPLLLSLFVWIQHDTLQRNYCIVDLRWFMALIITCLINMARVII